MGQVTFVIWRESIEALLLISIIYAWLKQHIDGRHGLKYLWGGVVIGCIASVVLALLIYGVFNILDDTGQSLFYGHYGNCSLPVNSPNGLLDESPW